MKKIILILLLSGFCAQQTEASGLCKRAIASLNPTRLKHILYTKNPIPDKGEQRLFSDELLPYVSDNSLIFPSVTPAQIEMLRDRVFVYARTLYRWNFITKSEYSSYEFSINASAQLPKRVRDDTKHPSAKAEEAANPFYPENAEEIFKKPAREVTVDDMIAVIDPSWHKIERQIRLSRNILALHPGWRIAGSAAQGLGKLLLVAIVFSIAYGVIESVNSYVKDPQVAEARRLSYFAGLKMNHGSSIASPGDKERDRLLDLYQRKSGMFSSLEIDARDELIQAFHFVALMQIALNDAMYVKKDIDLVKNHLYGIYILETRFPDVTSHVDGASIKSAIQRLYKEFDPDGKFRAEFKRSY